MKHCRVFLKSDLRGETSVLQQAQTIGVPAMSDNRLILNRRDVLASAGGLSITGAMVSTVAPAVGARRPASAPKGGDSRGAH
jgi:hypothetical protein